MIAMKGSEGLSGFPYSHIYLLRCRFDGGEFKAKQVLLGTTQFICEGILACQCCGHEVHVRDGIVRMLDLQELSPEDLHELKLRDHYSTENKIYPDAVWDEQWGALELGPQLAALDVHQGAALLEFACGRGRYTTIVMEKCRRLLAVDFSLESLRVLAKKIPSEKEIGLVQADITRLVLAPAAFDRVLSTTCLDSREQRMAMHRLASEALAADGRYVYGVEFNDLKTRLLGLSRAERYAPGDMLFYRLSRKDVVCETAPFFRKIQSRPMKVSLPFVNKFPPKWRIIIARLAAHIPLAREFGELLLVKAEGPIRNLQEGDCEQGNRVAKAIYGWIRGNQRSKV